LCQLFSDEECYAYEDNCYKDECPEHTSDLGVKIKNEKKENSNK
jgi:hypothetical protein